MSEREKLIAKIHNLTEGALSAYGAGKLSDFILQREREARIEENQQWIKWLDKPHGGGPADFDFDDRIAELTQKDGDGSV